jgi:hypothetical protein
MSDSTSNTGDGQAATATNDPAPSTQQGDNGFDAAAWQQFATEVDLSPEEARRRIDHSRTWERRAKDNHDAAQRLPQIEQTLTETTQRAETAEQRVADLEPENLRLRVALETGLPAELIDRLKGDNEDELKADAESLLKLVVPDGDPPARTPRPVPSQGGDGGGAAGLNEDRLLSDVKNALRIS